VAHTDDEVLGCGGLIQVLAEKNWRIRVVHMCSPALMAGRDGKENGLREGGLHREFIRKNYDIGVVWKKIREIGLAEHERNTKKRGRLVTTGEENEILPSVLEALPKVFSIEDVTRLMHRFGNTWAISPKQRAQFHRVSTNWELHEWFMQHGYGLQGLDGKRVLYKKEER